MQPIFHAILQNELPAFLSLVRERDSWLEERNDEQHSNTVLHMAAKHGRGEFVSKIIELRPSLICSRNAYGNTPLHLAALFGDVNIIMTMLEFGPEACSARNNNNQTPLHLACRSISVESATLFAETIQSVGLHELNFAILSGMAGKCLYCTSLRNQLYKLTRLTIFVHYIRKRTDKRCKNNFGFAAYQLIPQEAINFELLSRWLRFDTETPEELNSEESDEDQVIRMLTLIEINTSEIAERKRRSKEEKVKRGHEGLEYKMHIEALQNARNTIAIVAVLIASVAYAGGINPPGGVYQDGPWRGKSIVGKTTAFKVFAICNNIALFTSLAIVILLVSIIPYKRKPLKKLLVATHRMMWVSIGFMATAYVAASWVTIPHYHGTRWLFPAIVAVGGGALAVLFSYLGVEAIGHWFKKKARVGRVPSSSSTSEREVNAIGIMEPQNEKAEEGDRLEEATGEKEFVEESKEKAAEMSRKEKRKAMKKLKRKQVRKEIASKEREDAEAKLNDPAEQEKLKAIEEEEARKREKELREFEESERAWREAMEIKRKKEEEEERRWKELEELRKLEASRDGECGEDGEYEYIEEGPPEIIFKGNEIILRKNKVRVPKKSVPQVEGNEIADRPTSNPLPPGTEALPKYQNVSSAQQILDSVAQEVPNFGTEQDKAHCPFHLKTGACRFGPRCSRVHFYPDKSCTILMKNMYNGPGIAWEHDEGLEYTDEEAEHCYEEFYEDVHTEFLKYGELINFKVCRNGSFHLKGNVYVHYRSLESAVLAYQSINGRYFAGKQVNCEFVNISRWKVAICGEYMKSRLKTCSRGSACNFIHCFRNPGGDYEWADFDKPPPRFWIRKMTALFGYSDEYLRHMEREYSGSLRDCRSDQLTDSQRQPSRRSRSRDHDHVNVGSKPSYRSRDSSRGHRHSRHEENHHGGDGSPNSTRDGSLEREIYKEPRHGKETSRHESKWSEHSPTHRVPRKRIHERYSDDDSGDDDGRGETSHKRKSSRRYPRRGSDSEVQEQLDDQEESRTHWSSSERRSRKEDDREGSSASQEESRAHDRVHAVGDKSQRQRSSSRYSHERDSSESRHRRHRGSYDGENDRRRSVETSPRDKDRDKSKQRHSYNKTGDPDSSNRGRKGKQGRESQEVKRNASGSSSDEEREERHKERSHSSHRKRRRSSQHSSHEQTPKEPDEIEPTPFSGAANSVTSAKVVLITGVSKGLGRALSLEMAKRGHTVIGCARTQEKLTALQSELSSPENHLLLTADVKSDSSVKEMAHTIMEKKGVPDIIVNNAGTINKNNKIWEVSAEDFDSVMDTNVKGVVNVLRHFIPLMLPRKQGIIVNMSSGWGRSGAALVAPYCASKWAIEGLSRSVAKEVAEGMAVVALNPGVINTEMLTSCFGNTASLYQAPDAWAVKAATMILNLTAGDNGGSLTV
ncbi:unnamed protein product [Brassica napus]|uniref:(rape) hypothetical protein n=1 Tax=Brassica napus TaxID=3708 RepID=A0A817ACX6_BRANA|nr:unnamed protein product [Brassica napus]